jgi:hypothetical protein
MSENVLLPAITGLLGALIGSLGSIVTSLFQSRVEHRRERVRLAVQLTIEQHRIWADVDKAKGSESQAPVLTLLSNFDMLSEMTSGHTISPDMLAKQYGRFMEMRDTLEGLRGADPG